jgi:hypothetical protein
VSRQPGGADDACFGSRSIEGVLTGSAIDNEDTLAFSVLANIRPIQAPRGAAAIEIRPAIRTKTKRSESVNTITTKGRTRIHFNGRGSGRPVVFGHGWPLSADAFEDPMFFLASRSNRCVAPDGAFFLLAAGAATSTIPNSVEVNHGMVLLKTPNEKG